MGYKGVIKGNVLELEELLPFPEGIRLEMAVIPEPKPRKGSPKAILQLASTLTPEKAEAILKAAQECQRIDWVLWEIDSLQVEDSTKPMGSEGGE